MMGLDAGAGNGPTVAEAAGAMPRGRRPRQRRNETVEVDGLLAIAKPEGVISKDVSRLLAQRVGRLKMGHVGTLDPAASGVLPILLGRATRLQDYLLERPKTYEFDIAFGYETDTLDRDGTVIGKMPWEHVTELMLRDAMQAFLGDIEQTPPMYSAVKYQGKPLYEYARRGGEPAEAVPLASLTRRVRIDTIELLDFRPGQATLRVTCSKGTYIRTLAKDLAARVGSCGTLVRLVRTQAAGIRLSQAQPLASILEYLDNTPGDMASLVVPMEQIDLGMRQWRCPRPEFRARLRGGQEISLDVGDFAAGVSISAGPDDRLLPGAWACPTLLLDEQGKSIGIGSIRRHESGRINIVMKRGL